MRYFNIEDKKVVAGIDLGSTHIRCLIGSLSDNQIHVLGAARIPHSGLCKGRIINMKEVSKALQQSIEEAEVMAGINVSQIFLSLSGDYNIFFSDGMSIIPSRQVTLEDLDKAVETAKAVALASGHQLLHVLPKGFYVDRQGPFFNPLGLSGLRLETSVMILSIPESNAQNTLQCLRYAGFSPKGLILQPVATSLALLNEEERNSGVCILDIGQDESYFTVCIDSQIHYIGSLSMSGEDFTQDLMSELKISRDIAEDLKLKYGNILPVQEWDHQEENNIESVETDGVSIEQKKIRTILSTRAELVFEEIKTHLQTLDYWNKIPDGFIVAGAVSSLKGLVEKGRSILDKTVKKPFIRDFSGLSEIDHKMDFITSLGVLNYVQQEKTIDYRSHHSTRKTFKFKSYFQDLFS